MPRNSEIEKVNVTSQPNGLRWAKMGWASFGVTVVKYCSSAGTVHSHSIPRDSPIPETVASNSGSNFLREARTKAQESYLVGVIYSTCRVDLSCYPESGHYNSEIEIEIGNYARMHGSP